MKLFKNCIVLIFMLLLLSSCGNKNKNTEKEVGITEPQISSAALSEALKKAIDPLQKNWVSSNDVQAGITEKVKEQGIKIIDFMKLMDGKIMKTTNRNVALYSFTQSETSVLANVVFLRDEPVENMRDFISIVNECSQQIFSNRPLKDRLMAIFLGYSTDGEAVCGFSMYPTEQVFSLTGYEFLSEKANVYRDAFDTLVKEKNQKTDISEWDYYIFRSMMEPDIEKLTNICERTTIGIGGTTILSLYHFKDGFEKTFLGNKGMAEQMFSLVTESPDSKSILDTGFPISTIWFNGSKKRIMAEMTRKLPSGKIDIDRKWFNGYYMP